MRKILIAALLGLAGLQSCTNIQAGELKIGSPQWSCSECEINTLQGCEYIVCGTGNCRTMTHKGNCKTRYISPINKKR